jgi:hypothetical protein
VLVTRNVTCKPCAKAESVWRASASHAKLERGHGQRIGLGPGDLCFAHGCGNPRDPLDRRLGELIQILRAIEGAIGYQVGGSIRGLSLIDVSMDHLAHTLVDHCYCH